MGWKTDWLYKLIFMRIREIWDRARHESERFNQSAAVRVDPDRVQSLPKQLLIQQCANADLLRTICVEPIVRSWVYMGHGFEEQKDVPKDARRRCRVAPSEDEPLHNLFTQGTVRFHISDDRKQVVFTYILGPLNGRGYVCDVIGQGSTGTLENSPNSIGWVS